MATIRCPLAEAAHISKHEKGLICAEGELTFYEYDQLVSAAALRLVEAGCAAGEPVALVLPHDWRYPVLLLAVIRTGGVVCPMDAGWSAAETAGALASIGGRKIVLAAADDRGRAMGDAEVLRAEDLAALAAPCDDSVFETGIESERPATILFTAPGEGGRKAVLHAFASHYYSARGANANIRVHSGDRWLLTVPLHLAEGVAVVFRCLVSGGTLVVPHSGRRVAKEIVESDISHVSLAGEQLREVLEEGLDVRGNRRLAAVMAGARSDPAIVREALGRAWPLFLAYGRTEMASQVAAIDPPAPPDRRSSAGRVLKYRELRLADDGEILVKGHTLFRGYVEGGAVRPAVDAAGWFATGDLGRIDGDGYLHMLGRRDA